ncbi:MAG: aminotransferase class III-fold pyridoxal phosphate-dependent enzyme [SAR324 cluster bacterium]|nr:aminotransferase class III-fold pyridoxal phosphate-dependent enzyme [SAR324 cluster bacterium]
MTSDFISTFEQKTPGSKRLNEVACQVTPGGISHDSRYHAPYPLYVTRAKGSKVWDVDGNAYHDLWMAHYDAILGHAPPMVVDRLKEAMEDGLHIGMAMEHEVALAQKVVEVLPCAQQVRFCASGTEATMYAVRLARGFTGRNVILKIVGGWHGANTDLMIDVRPPEYIGPEGAGLPPDLNSYTRSVQLNDIEDTAKAIREAGDDFAGIILEVAMGAGGFIVAEPDYLSFLREETTKRGAVLIFDEVITGFRLALGGAQEYVGVTPDLTTLGKILGGGMPVGAIAGRADVMEISAVTPKRSKREKVLIGGGTYSCNPLTMIAGAMTLNILQSRKNEIYPALAETNQRMCDGIRGVFADVALPVLVNQVGSLMEVHFLKEEGLPVRSMADVVNNTYKDKQAEYATRMRNHGVFLLHGGGLSVEHTETDIQGIVNAHRAVAQEMAEGN